MLEICRNVATKLRHINTNDSPVQNNSSSDFELLGNAVRTFVFVQKWFWDEFNFCTFPFAAVIWLGALSKFELKALRINSVVFAGWGVRRHRPSPPHPTPPPTSNRSAPRESRHWRLQAI
eukprot:1923631-Amphidinium_carterae.1